MRGLVHHIDLTVTDPDAAFPLYDAVLRFMGYALYKQDEHGFDWKLGHHSVGVLRAQGPHAGRRHDRYTPGLHHLAWAADSREDVDRLYQLLLSLGATILDAPADYPQYNKGRGYYAVFFADPDGIKLEYAFTPPG